MVDTFLLVLIATVIVMNVAQLFLLHTLEKEFRNNQGHSMRDLADRLETMLLTAEKLAVGVAADLSNSIGRADATTGPPGVASDAALRSPEKNG